MIECGEACLFEHRHAINSSSEVYRRRNTKQGCFDDSHRMRLDGCTTKDAPRTALFALPHQDPSYWKNISHIEYDDTT